ncbi:hypothetical protein [Enterococcus wangshanyuanii]|uniref:DUF4352 domain-containing protein n=1 Tax=Enterococcus wangshanyuanii TaxID=2005703 RepID=A0ABQ1NRT8_9ENTE|nr:hypothetical protein [Enterococcus wangshanyuanii]GGC82264.1 hypothetical protein GCM10011573_09920 [Enterococcus wangshanyuanii]
MKKRKKMIISIFIGIIILGLIITAIYMRTYRKEAGVIEMKSNDSSYITGAIDNRNKEVQLVIENKTTSPENFIVEFYNSEDNLINSEKVTKKKYEKKIKVAKNDMLNIKIISPSKKEASFKYLKKEKIDLW